MLLQVRMEEEIESWYEEEKPKYMDEYLKNIETARNHEEAEKKYNYKLNKLVDKYNKLMIEAIQRKKAGKLKNLVSSIKNIFFLIIILLLINSCASINKNQAEAKAVEFVKQNVKFFAREENSKNSTLNLTQYSVESMTSFQEKSNWVVVMHVSAKAGNTSKKNDLVIKLDRNGDVAELNGKKVQK